MKRIRRDMSDVARTSYSRGSIRYAVVRLIVLVGLSGSLNWEGGVSAQPTYSFEKIGNPLQIKDVPIKLVTDEPVLRAWALVESPYSANSNTLIGIAVGTGKTTKLDLGKFGQGHTKIHRSPKGNIYIYTGSPARFLKYDPISEALIDFGPVAEDGWYALGYSIGPDGRIWVGSYPNTELCWMDPDTDEMGRLGPIADDPRQQYIRRLEVSDQNIVYCAVGLHHAELWAIEVSSGKKQQILPKKIIEKQGFVSLMLAEDGDVYGYRDGLVWRCRPDGVDFVEELPSRKKIQDQRVYGGRRFMSLNSAGNLVVQSVADRANRILQTDFSMPSKKIYSLGSIIGGKLYGGGFKDATLFTYDLQEGKLTDLGIVGGGKVQIYDIIGHPRGVFFTSYSKGVIEHYDPVSGEVTPIIELEGEAYQQERLTQLCLGPDGMIYTGTIPVKGIVGGGLVRVNPTDFSVDFWRNIVHEQSLISVLGVPATDEVFFTSSVRGGTSAIPTKQEAVVGFWDVKRERVAWQGKPIPGTARYGLAALGSDGMIYGVADNKYYVIDPSCRKVVKVAELPVSGVHHLAFMNVSSGADGMIYGLGDDALFAIDPVKKEVKILARHDSITGAQGISAAENGDIYYGSGPSLWRARVIR